MPGLVAIHQPNFLPWLGFFDKLARADVFVLLDDVQFPKKGGTWTNRVRMLVSEKPSWVTVPVDRSYGGQRTIDEMRIGEQKPWRRKLIATIEASYGRAPHFEEVMSLLAPHIENRTDRLAEYNRSAIEALADALELSPRLVASKSLETSGQATDRLIDLVKAVGGDSYLAGGGAGGYQEDSKFEAAGIELVPQAFSHPAYPQPVSPPVAGLSVVDALVNCGIAGTRKLLRR